MNCSKYQDLSPNQIVPRLADEGIYLASESTMYRLLRQDKMNRHRQRQARQPATSGRPKPAEAAGPNQVWSWDITWLPTQVKGIFVYLHIMIDIYNRKLLTLLIFQKMIICLCSPSKL